jgi:hypothetical protein
MNVTKKKLNLNQETLRNLNENEARKGVAGFLISPGCTGNCTCGIGQGGCTCPPPQN